MHRSTTSNADRRLQTIVVVHGLWMTGAVFALQRAQLARRGYRALAFSYPSMRLALDEIASRLSKFVIALGVAHVHLVGHSLGGLVVLNALALDPQMPVGRVVLLGTPATGSRVAHRLARSTVTRALIGRALLEWRPERGTVVAAMCDVGMIAGTLRFGIGSLLLDLPAPNDGVVCLEETRMTGLCDHLEMHLSHSGMIVSSRATNQICHFLEHGHFARS